MGPHLSKDMRALVSKIEGLGFAVQVQKGRHYKLKLSHNGECVATMVCASTPSCRRARLNQLAYARRLASRLQ